jgi:hypothetical protein
MKQACRRTRYEDYRDRSLRSLSKKEFVLVVETLLHYAKPEEGDQDSLAKT